MSGRPESIGREVLFDVADHLAIVTLNRPEKRNAVNGAVTEALEWIVQAVEADPEIRVAILTSSNDTVFCAGADLSEFNAGRGHLLVTEQGGFGGFTDAKKDKPWIAAVTGAALGGGTELALACDMIVVADNARFGLPEVKRGLIAGAGGVYRLPRAIPRAIALELIATGEPLSVERAAAFGMVNHVVAPQDVLATARALAASIAGNAPLSVKESMIIARQAVDVPPRELQRLSLEATVRVSSSEDAREGALAFLEKRAPVWKGR